MSSLPLAGPPSGDNADPMARPGNVVLRKHQYELRPGKIGRAGGASCTIARRVLFARRSNQHPQAGIAGVERLSVFITFRAHSMVLLATSSQVATHTPRWPLTYSINSANASLRPGLPDI